MVTRNAKLPFSNVCIELTKRKTTLNPSEDIGSGKLSLLLTLSVLLLSHELSIKVSIENYLAYVLMCLL